MTQRFERLFWSAPDNTREVVSLEWTIIEKLGRVGKTHIQGARRVGCSPLKFR